MFNNFSSFKDLDFENLNEFNSELEGPKSNIFSHFQGKQIVEPTAEGELFGFEDFVMNKNVPVDDRSYQISFESTFMQEHECALKKQTENFIESSFKLYDDQTISFKSEEIFGKQLENSSFAAEEDHLTKNIQSEQFLKKGQKEEKLHMFIDLIYQSYPKQFANEFMILSSVAYNKHTETRNDEETEKDISKKAKKLAEDQFEKLFSDQRINYLNLKTVSTSKLNSQAQIKEAFKCYLEFLFTTVMLISEQYFENPYTENDGMKRERSFKLESDEENDFSSSENFTFGIAKKRSH